eukprot:gene4347-14463_t
MERDTQTTQRGTMSKTDIHRDTEAHAAERLAVQRLRLDLDRRRDRENRVTGYKTFGDPELELLAEPLPPPMYKDLWGSRAGASGGALAASYV